MPSAKFDVEMSGFRSGIAAAKNEVKTLDAQMKNLDATMKVQGKSEQTLSQQTETLNKRMTAQRNIAENAQKALAAMSREGIDPASDSYQRMARELLNAQTSMMETQAAMNDLGKGAEQAAGGVEKLESGLNGISKKISLEQVRSGISAIDKGLENAAKKAVNLGKAIWENITDVARFSDDTATQAMILNMDIEDYQAYKKVFDTVGEITVQEWQKAKQKVQKAINDPTDEQVDILELLGIKTHDIEMGKLGEVQGAAKDFETVFWEIGETLKKKVESGEMTQDLADTYANALFGKSFANLNPMFDMGRNDFEQAVKEQTVASEEAIKANAELNDKLIKLQGDFESLKVEVVGGLAPALTSATEAVDGLLTSVLNYLKTPEGQKALADLGTAVSGLFDDLGKIDPDKVVEGFTSVLNTVVGSIQWLVDNKDSVVHAMEVIVAGWGALKLTGGILDVLKVINGLQGLTGHGGAEAGIGSAVGSAMTGAAGKAVGGVGNAILLNNIPAIGDWFVHNTPLGQELFLGTREKGSTWKDIQENARTFADDWKNNALIKPIIDGYTNAINFWNEFYTNAGKYIQIAGENTYGDDWTIEDALREATGGTVPVEITPEAPEDSAARLAEQIGTVKVYADIVPLMNGYVQGVGGAGGSGRPNVLMPKANGISFVPYDGYLALLHKGEQVVPARQVNSRNFTSNMYFENVNVNNGQDAEGLAARITAQQRREMSGYGSM